MSMEATAPTVTLTERAARRVSELATHPDHDGLMLRVSVQGGGCSGFSYDFTFDDEKRDEDLVVERDGAVVLVDEISLGLLGGAEIDFVDELVGASFVIRNPNATSSCGCGNSFSVG
ncbi:MAG: iron-sulfur cluster insertion protein ErpA [Acetobacterales bacterium]